MLRTAGATYSVFGWHSGLLFAAGGVCPPAFRELMEKTDWDAYMAPAAMKNARTAWCITDMETSTVEDTFGSLSGGHENRQDNVAQRAIITERRTQSAVTENFRPLGRRTFPHL